MAIDEERTQKRLANTNNLQFVKMGMIDDNEQECDGANLRRWQGPPAKTEQIFKGETCEDGAA